jgi:hypothetical protein
MADQLPIATLTQQLMQRTLQQKALALPFARDIFLLETHVAGLHYYDIHKLTMPLQTTDTLLLRREPTNSHDELAIEIFTLNNGKLGYVPRHRNPVLARLMDAGKTLVAEVAELKLGNTKAPAYLPEPAPGNDITDVRLRIALRE